LFSEYNVKELRIFGLHNYFYKLYKEITERFFRQNRQIFSGQSKKRSIIQVVSESFWIFAYYFSAKKALFGLISIGTFNLYLSAFNRITNSLQMIFSDLATLYENNLYLEDLFVLLNMPKESFEQIGGKKIDNKEIEIKIENLSFSYPGSSKLVLKNINMVIKPKESVALVGHNGAGKTTFVKLLCGLYTPTSGQILINGIPLSELDLASYRQLVSIVFQDFSYYHFTAKENIGFGDLDNLHNDEKIISASKKAGAHEFISGLANGYKQQIGKHFEGGVNLSMGQFQKLALARAFMKDSSVMILDEPTASSDTKAELKLFSHIEKIADKKSLILISHRFSTVKIAQKIYVIEKGEIIEEGNHRSLMDKGGIYAKLYTMQAESYKD
ncbi:MAG: ABC transporter ATP-binding protein, partial [Patescibacteria group bacterium]